MVHSALGDIPDPAYLFIPTDSEASYFGSGSDRNMGSLGQTNVPYPAIGRRSYGIIGEWDFGYPEEFLWDTQHAQEQHGLSLRHYGVTP